MFTGPALTCTPDGPDPDGAVCQGGRVCCTCPIPCPVCARPPRSGPVSVPRGEVQRRAVDPVTRAWLWVIVLAAVACLLALVVATGVAMGTLTR